MDVFGKILLSSGKVVVFWEDVVVFGQSCFVHANVVVFGKMWKYSGRVVVIGQKWLSLGQKLFYSGKNGFIREKVVVFEQSGCIG